MLYESDDHLAAPDGPSRLETRSSRAAASAPSGRRGRRTIEIPLLSVVVPVFNEADAVETFWRATIVAADRMAVDCELIFTNDGSTDRTLDELLRLRARDKRVKVVDLSRNFGKEAALSAGLDHARGDVVAVMDVDMQDPPELLEPMLARWREGYDVVCGRRTARDVDRAFKRLSAGQFYRLFNRISQSKIPADVGDFRIMDRRVVDALGHLPERVRFMKGLFAWVGFKVAFVDYPRPERSRGESKFGYWRLWNFALDGITSFSTVPLRIWSYFGALVAALSFLYASLIVLRTLLFGTDVPGYASTLAAVLFLGGVQLIGLGILGEYLGRVYSEVKRRPLYLAAGLYGVDAAPPAHDR